jgi:hypothetical protein
LLETIETDKIEIEVEIRTTKKIEIAFLILIIERGICLKLRVYLIEA